MSSNIAQRKLKGHNGQVTIMHETTDDKDENQWFGTLCR